MYGIYYMNLFFPVASVTAKIDVMEKLNLQDFHFELFPVASFASVTANRRYEETEGSRLTDFDFIMATFSDSLCSLPVTMMSST